MAKAPDEPITFVAAIADSVSAIRIEGEKDSGGRVVLEVPGTDLGPLIRLATLRGRVLQVTIQVLDGG